MAAYQIKDGGVFRLESVETVEIVELVHDQPFPGFHRYSLKIRAKIVMPTINCHVSYANSKVTRNGATLGSGLMVQESPGSEWWRTKDTIVLMGANPGDVIRGEVEATWMCTEHGEEFSVPITL